MFIFSNLASSVDGKIATNNRSHLYLGTPHDRRQMMVLRAKAQAVLVGASTLRAFQRAITTSLTPLQKQPLNVVVSSRLDDFDAGWSFFKNKRTRRLLFVGARAPLKRVKLFEGSCEIVRLKTNKPIAQQIVKELERRGIKRLLLEGGGELMWNFASHNMIDEYNVTLTPWIVGGGGAPTMVEGAGFMPHRILGLKLKSCKVVGDELYLVYRKKAGRAK